jgi:hypothetical protein
MTDAQFRTYAADAVTYERSHLPQLVAAYRYRRSHPNLPSNLFPAGNTLASRIAAQFGPGTAKTRRYEQQSRVAGTACDGSYGMQQATPAVSILTSGNYLVAGAGTSCRVAQVVATARGDSSQPGSALLSVPDRSSGRRLTLRCRGLSQVGPVVCAGEGATVYVGAEEAPLRLSS